MRTAFVLGVLATIVAAAVVAAAVIASGVVDVAARPHGPLDRVLAYASTRSLARHAPRDRNPLAGDPAAARRGLDQYRDDCVACHGAPGGHPSELAGGLHPSPPDLASRAIQSFSDGMLYRAIAGGVDSTGMPAFGKTHTPDEIWSIVAFLRRLPSLTPEERQALGRKEGEEGHEGSEHGPQAPAAGGAGEPAPKGAAAHVVRITGFKFEPPTLEVHAGDVVEWKNEDFTAHTATADDRTFDTGPIDAGASKRVVVRKKGTFPYFCTYHIGMKGTLVVH